MEEKKLDINSIIGFILIFGILIWIMYQNQPSPEELQAQEQAKQAEIEAKKAEAKIKSDSITTTAEDYSASANSDSLRSLELRNKLGAFAYASTFPAKAYIDEVPSFASNEVCINWNAPAVTVLIVLIRGRPPSMPAWVAITISTAWLIKNRRIMRCGKKKSVVRQRPIAACRVPAVICRALNFVQRMM